MKTRKEIMEELTDEIEEATSHIVGTKNQNDVVGGLLLFHMEVSLRLIIDHIEESEIAEGF